jgi:NDP-sugar pyrophosphorylase family protein
MELKIKKVVIQAGGKGTRLYPVTLEMPKPLLTVRRKPILNYLIEFFRKYGIVEPIVVIHKDHVEDYKWWKKRYADSLPQKLKIFVEPEPLGTFGGLKFLRRELKEPFFFTNGDELKSFDLRDMIKEHAANVSKPRATIALFKVPNPSDYGVAILKGKRISEFLEKPKDPPSNYINSGLALLEPEIFDYADFPKGFLMIERDIYPRVAAAGKLAGYKIKNGKWFDCGTLERWERAIKEW